MKRSRIGKLLVFDMDGTLANTYGVDGWLEKLRRFDESPYADAEPLVDMFVLKELLLQLKKLGYRIAITSWLSKESNKEYDDKVRKVKKEWLDKHEFPYDELHFVKYGTPKRYPTNPMNKNGLPLTQIIIDDDDRVLIDWQKWYLGYIDAKKQDICKELADILIKEIGAESN